MDENMQNQGGEAGGGSQDGGNHSSTNTILVIIVIIVLAIILGLIFAGGDDSTLPEGEGDGEEVSAEADLGDNAAAADVATDEGSGDAN